MSVEERIRTCRLLEKMKVFEACGKRLGLEDLSRMQSVQDDKNKKRFVEKG